MTVEQEQAFTEVTAALCAEARVRVRRQREELAIHADDIGAFKHMVTWLFVQAMGDAAISATESAAATC